MTSSKIHQSSVPPYCYEPFAIAAQRGFERTKLLAPQSVGGAMGNMVAVHNIVAVCSVLGLRNVEGEILRKTVIPMLIYGLMAAVAVAVIL